MFIGHFNKNKNVNNSIFNCFVGIYYTHCSIIEQINDRELFFTALTNIVKKQYNIQL